MLIGLLKKTSHTFLHLKSLSSAKHRDSLIIDYFDGSDITFTYIILDDYCSKKNRFSTSWKYNRMTDTFIDTNTPCSPDIIRNLCSYHTYTIYHKLAAYPIICSEHIAQIADNKQNTYEFLYAYQPKSILLKYYFGNTKIQKEFGDEVVIKPIYGNGGNGVELISADELISNEEKRSSQGFIYLVQQKLDASAGYPGITTMNHDLRLYCICDNIIDIVVREKQSTKEFKVNVSQGGTARTIDIALLPKELITLAHNIITTITPKEKDIYTLDFMYDSIQKKWFLIEVNSNPGFRNIHNLPIHELTFLKAIDTLLH